MNVYQVIDIGRVENGATFGAFKITVYNFNNHKKKSPET